MDCAQIKSDIYMRPVDDQPFLSRKNLDKGGGDVLIVSSATNPS